MANNQNKHWDIFCKIVDNFGDIGVCWRLSQQLAKEHGLQIRLFIDDLETAAKLIGSLQESHSMQLIEGVEIVPWVFADHAEPAEVVLETFSCELPQLYLQKMAASKCAWVNVEYLSAEKWVNDFHAQPSQQPALNMTKYFFFPGFTESTGGLLREQNLITQRNAFISNLETQQEFWQAIGVNYDVQDKEVRNISLFGYPEANVKDLIAYLENASFKTNIFMPLSSITPACKNYFPQHDFNIGTILSSRQLNLQVLPFLSQPMYDRLLWACDMNFVRGEDSWIRAIWAGKPFIWQPYIQAENTHLTKLEAFLQLYMEHAAPDMKDIIHNAHLAWSNANYDLMQNSFENSSQEYFVAFLDRLQDLQMHAQAQSKTWASQLDLASKLVIFSEKIQQNQV